MAKLGVRTLYSDYPSLFLVTDAKGMGISCHIIGSPTGNCQSSSINNAQELIDRAAKEEDDIRDYLVTLSNAVDQDRSLFILDIYEGYFQSIKDKLFFLTATPYLNLTGSKMRLCLVNPFVNPTDDKNVAKES